VSRPIGSYGSFEDIPLSPSDKLKLDKIKLELDEKLCMWCGLIHQKTEMRMGPFDVILCPNMRATEMRLVSEKSSVRIVNVGKEPKEDG
jgi:hypothetical protein